MLVFLTSDCFPLFLGVKSQLDYLQQCLPGEFSHKELGK